MVPGHAVKTAQREDDLKEAKSQFELMKSALGTEEFLSHLSGFYKLDAMVRAFDNLCHTWIVFQDEAFMTY